MVHPKLFGGVEAGGTKFLCGVADENGVILDQVRIATTTPAETLGAVDAFFAQAGARHGPLAALSIGSFGPLSLRSTAPDYGSITSTPKVGWSHVDLLGHFQRTLGVPVALDTDVNCSAVGEYLFGSGQGLGAFCYVTIGTGIGVGHLLGGVPHTGANHPEAGHIRLPRAPGDQAFEGICPFHGDCLEGLACGPAMQARWGVPAEELPPRHPAWAIAADYIAGLCATLTYILRPDRIIVGGGVMQQADMYPRVRTALEAKLAGYDASLRGLDIDAYVAEPTAGASAGLTGALAIAHRLITRQWPMHWVLGAHQNSVSTLSKVS
ncbi:ROK family protein [Caulobacter sp. LARHSG274]